MTTEQALDILKNKLYLIDKTNDKAILLKNHHFGVETTPETVYIILDISDVISKDSLTIYKISDKELYNARYDIELSAKKVIEEDEYMHIYKHAKIFVDNL